MNSLESTVQDGLQHIPDSTRLTSLQRCTSLFAQSETADAMFLIHEGLIKLTRANESGDKIILAIVGPGQLVGEEALSDDAGDYYSDAVVLTSTTVTRLPRKSLVDVISTNFEVGRALVGYLLTRKLALAKKVELLCLHDVEYRILHYLAELSSLLPAGEGSREYQIPITQLELADLIGATRETTSTTLNQLERRGLIRLSRRLLTVPAPDELRKAAVARASPAAVANGVRA